MGAFDINTMNLLGIDPDELRRQQIFDALGALGAGLLSGRSWGEGLGAGVYGAQQGMRNARENAITEGVRGFELQRIKDEQDRRRALEEGAARLPMPGARPGGFGPPGRPAGGAFDPAVWDLIPADEKIDIYKQIWAQSMESPDAPTVRDFYEGGMTVQKQFNPSTGQWEEVGRGSRWQPQAAPRLALDASVIDPATGNKIYATGPLKGQIAELASTSGGFSLGAGQVRYDAAGNVIATGPEAPAKAPTEFQAWREAFRDENKRYPNSKEVTQWKRGGGLTLPQEANNAEVDAARRYLTDSGFAMDEILRRTQETTSTGRENPDYDPYLAQTYRLAMSRKVGDDPDFESFQRRYRGGGATPSGPGGSTSDAAALPRTDAGDIDVSKLTTTDIYDDGAGGRWKWTGTDFVAVP